MLILKNAKINLFIVSEMWTMADNDEHILRIFKREVLRKISEPIRDTEDTFRLQMKMFSELNRRLSTSKR